MTANGWFQILFYSVAVARPDEAAGRVHGPGVRRLGALARARRAVDLSRLRRSIRRRTSIGRATPGACCSSALRVHAGHLRGAPAAGPFALEPGGAAGRRRPPGVRDGGVVHDQHELAVVCGRDDDVVLLPDDAAHLPQLHVGGRRHGRGRRARARHRAPLGRDDRATSGSIWCAARSTSCCRSRSSWRCVLVQQGVIQNFAHYVDRHHARRREADARDGPGGEPDRDQAARAPTAADSSTSTRRIRSRTPTPSPTSSRCSRSSSIPAGAGCTRSAGMVKNQKHGWALWAAMFVAVLRRRDDGVLGRGARQPDPRRARRRRRGLGARTPAATWRARKSASGSRTPRSWATATTDASNGSVNAMHDSFTPLGGHRAAGQHPAR